MATKTEVLEALKGVEDPELMMSVVDLGLIYQVDIREDEVRIEFTLTTPGCPAGDMIHEQIVEKAEEATGLPVHAELVWIPQWAPEYMTDEAKIALGFPI